MATREHTAPSAGAPRRSSAAGFNFGRQPLPNLNVLAAALMVLPEAERYAFAEAIGARASVWRLTPAGDTPEPWPAVVRVDRDPGIEEQ